MSEAAALQTHTAKAPSSDSQSLLVQRKCACGGSSGLTGSCAGCEKKKLLGKPLQAKLRVNEPGDEYEQEAERVAEQVMRMTEPEKKNDHAPKPATALVQRRVNGRGNGLGVAPPIVHEVLSSPGQPLDDATRAFFEPRFGHDFSTVRVHADAKASASAREVNALAYTSGRHLVLADRASSDNQGKKLLAHELAHVVQQGGADRAHGISVAGALPGFSSGALQARPLEPAGIHSPVVQRACGRSIQAPEVCHPASGDVDDFAVGTDDVYLFARDCDDLEPGEEARLREAARWVLSDGDSVNVHGFASEEGDPIFNQALSCARANTAADVLHAHPLSITLYQHGAVPGERAARRSVVVEWPRATPAPATRCTTFKDFLGPLADPAYLTADIAECLCGPIKFLDMFEDVLAWMPGPVGSTFSADSVQTAISAADFLCNALDFVQLAWQLGQGADDCWSPSNYSAADIARLVALAGAMAIDAGAYPAGEKLGELVSGWLQTIIEETAAELVVSGAVTAQPEVVGAGLFLGFIVAPMVDRLAKSIVEFGFDAGSFILQNYLLSGTPFPLGTCRACARLGHRVRASVDESLCEKWNQAIPEAIRFPSMESRPRAMKVKDVRPVHESSFFARRTKREIRKHAHACHAAAQVRLRWLEGNDRFL